MVNRKVILALLGLTNYQIEGIQLHNKFIGASVDPTDLIEDTSGTELYVKKDNDSKYQLFKQNNQVSYA